MDFASLANKYHLTADIVVVSIILAGQFRNHFWRLFCMFLAYQSFNLITAAPALPWYLFIGLCAAIWFIPHLRWPQKKTGCIFITGCDSGMGQATALYLAERKGYETIFAGCFNPEAAAKTFSKFDDVIVPVALDVTKDSSVADAAKTVKAFLEKGKTPEARSLVGLIQFHGVSYLGPVAYLPVEMYTRQIDVNFVGNIRMIQNFLPILDAGVATIRKLPKMGGFRGRIALTGTGGGPCSPCPALLSAYMSSKFACEAFVQSFRMELHLKNKPFDVSVVNPGFVKPTMLIEEGKKLTEKMWTLCEAKLGSDVARKEYGGLYDHFNEYSAAQPGTHVSEICKAVEDALTAAAPQSSYKVGPDSKAAPIVGMFPTGAREWIARNGIYGVLSPVGTVKGFTV